jgi:hypothetical protein
MKITTETTINRSIGDVWEVMGNQFAQVHLWSSNFTSSKAGGQAQFPGLDYSHRDTITDRGQTIQQLDAFDSENHNLSYHITKGLPPIASNAVGNWSLKRLGDNKTKAVFEFEMKPKNLFLLMLTPIIKKKLRTASNIIGEDLKYYLEKETPHPRKLEQLD